MSDVVIYFNDGGEVRKTGVEVKYTDHLLFVTESPEEHSVIPMSSIYYLDVRN